MPLSPLEYLRHILDETEYLISERKGINKEQFFRDATIKRAFVRSIEIIGEASKKVSSELKNRYPDVMEGHSWNEGSSNSRLFRRGL